MKLVECAKTIWKEHKFFVLILLMASVLMFLNLGDRILSGDDAGYSIHSKNVLTYGYPKMFDGKAFVGFEYQIGPGYAFMMNTWLGEYFIALSFFIFGVTNFSARFFSALFGIGTLIVTYLMALQISATTTFHHPNQDDKGYSKKIAIFAILFLAFTPLFYILCRTANYYGLSMFLISLQIFSYLQAFIFYRKNSSRTTKDWKKTDKDTLTRIHFRQKILFALSSIFLFYTHIQFFFFMMLIITTHYLLFYAADWKKLLKPYIMIFVVTFPYFIFWFVSSNVLGNVAGKVASQNLLLKIMTSLSISIFYYLIFAFPLLLVFFIPKILLQKKEQIESVQKGRILINEKLINEKLIKEKMDKEKLINEKLIKEKFKIFTQRFCPVYTLLLMVILGIAVLTAIFDNLATPAVRRVIIPTLPVFSILVAATIMQLFDIAKNKFIILQKKTIFSLFMIILVLILFTSNILFVFPLNLTKNIITEKLIGEEKFNFLTKALNIRSYQYEYVYELTHKYISPNDAILETIKSSTTLDSNTGAKKSVVLTNADMSITYFYLGIPHLHSTPPNSWSYKEIDVETIRNSQIDWIIVRNLDKKDFEQFINNNIDLDKYEKIIIQQKDEPWVDFENPISRRWKTDTHGEISIYHLIE